jgi:transposase
MPEQRRRFSPKFKAEAVQMVIETGKPIAEVARDLGVHDGTLGNWVNAWRREHPEPEQPLTPVEPVRVKEMEDEIRRLRMENEFLKKQRPSSPGRSRSRTLRADRGGAGHLRHCLDVSAARRVPLQLLRLAASSRNPNPGAAAAAGRARATSVRRFPADLRLPAGGRAVEPGRARVQR